MKKNSIVNVLKDSSIEDIEIIRKLRGTSEFELIVEKVLYECINESRKELPFSLTPKNLESLLPISSTKVYELLESGEIPSRKIGGKWAIQRDQFLAWFHSKDVTNIKS